MPKQEELPYVKGEFEEDGLKYQTTELPFEEDFSALEFNLPPSKTSERYTAQSVVKKSNLRMNRGQVSKSPTHPIKDRDLVWFAIINSRGGYSSNYEETPVEKSFGPYLIREHNNDFSIYLPTGSAERNLSDLLKKANPELDTENITSASVRLFRHVDREDHIGLSYAFEKEDSDDAYLIERPAELPSKPPMPPEKNKKQSKHYHEGSNPALEPIEGAGHEELDLHEHIEEFMRDDITKITKRHEKEK